MRLARHLSDPKGEIVKIDNGAEAGCGAVHKLTVTDILRDNRLDPLWPVLSLNRLAP